MRDNEAAARTKRSVMVNALGSEYETFLYAAIGESNDGTPLSVLTALARHNVDPWAEAAALAQLPKALAITRLTPAIAGVISHGVAADAAVNAARLIALLPQLNTLIHWYNPASTEQPRDFTLLVIYLLIGAMMMISAEINN